MRLLMELHVLQERVLRHLKALESTALQLNKPFHLSLMSVFGRTTNDLMADSFKLSDTDVLSACSVQENICSSFWGLFLWRRSLVVWANGNVSPLCDPVSQHQWVNRQRTAARLTNMECINIINSPSALTRQNVCPDRRILTFERTRLTV